MAQSRTDATVAPTATRFGKVALIGKLHSSATAHSVAVLQDIATFLQASGCQVVLEKSTAAQMGLHQLPVMDLAEIGAQCQLGLVVGGDGSMLHIGRQLAPFGVPLIGINQGRLGFITDIALDQFASVLGPMLDGDFDADKRSLITGKVMRGGQCIFEAMAMNDVVINRGANSGMVELRVEVGGHFVANQRADGLILATPTGCTAYSLSAGGPLLHPSIPGWVLVPIAPHTLSNRPIVLSDADEVAIEIVAGKDASANFDMQSLAELMIGDRIVMTRSQHSVCFLHPKGWSYFDTLRKKLHWNEGGS
ncbi:MAG TPA: NAD kinase [Burkholderiaceae bacterium]|mgnify:CR=1 FL=1|nr:NAD kinase [Burkholderiaceae bacterium]